MRLLTDQEIDAAYSEAANQTLRPQDGRIALAFAKAVEAAVIAKLTAGVSVEPVAWMDADKDIIQATEKSDRFAYTQRYNTPLYTSTAIAAARCKAIEEAAEVCVHESCSCCWNDDAVEMASHLADRVRALIGKEST